MSEDWKVGYKRTVLAAFARRASAVRKDPTFYEEWDRSIDLGHHFDVMGCGIDLERSTLPDDTSWIPEFYGTDADYSDVHGLEASITCQCLEFHGVLMRLEGTFSELLFAVLRED